MTAANDNRTPARHYSLDRRRLPVCGAPRREPSTGMRTIVTCLACWEILTGQPGAWQRELLDKDRS